VSKKIALASTAVLLLSTLGSPMIAAQVSHIGSLTGNA
jgi:hypothetical protein